MFRRMLVLVAALAVGAFLSGAAAGCHDDVKKVETQEQTHEGPVETVSPGEEVVE